MSGPKEVKPYYFLPEDWEKSANAIITTPIKEKLVSIQGQLISNREQTVAIEEKLFYDKLTVTSSITLTSGASGDVDLPISAGQYWEIFLTNHIGSGADIGLNQIARYDGASEHPIKTTHIGSGEIITLAAGDVLRGKFTNAGITDQVAYLRAYGKSIR